MQFGSVIILSRLLSPGDFGLLAMVAPVYMLALIFQNLGLGSRDGAERASYARTEQCSVLADHRCEFVPCSSADIWRANSGLVLR